MLQNGQRTAVKVPENMMRPPQFWQTTSLSPVTRVFAFACSLAKSAIVDAKSRLAITSGWATSLATGTTVPQLRHFRAAGSGS